MKSHRSSRLAETLGFVVLFCCIELGGHAAPVDPGWPRHYSDSTSHLVVHQPQVDQWRDFKVLTGRCAFALTPEAGRDPLYGTFRFEGDTLVDTNQKLVLLRNLRAFEMRFPSAPGGSSAEWSELTRRLLPADALVLSLDRVLAFVHAGEIPRKEARVLTEPPAIFVSTRPAVLVILDGHPVMLNLDNTSLCRILNTNWDLFQDRRTSVFYLRHSRSWLKANDLHGTFAPAVEVPSELSSLFAESGKPEADGGATVLADQPAAPRVIVVDKPSELVVIQGLPKLSAVAFTQLSVVTNTESDLFFHRVTRSYYFLASGRWFQAPGLEGPWQYASTSLPEDFKRIPPDHPRAHVLAAVPGTREAEDAILLATIPRTAEVNRSQAAAEVQYVGEPQFVTIPGSSISYARNTPSDVLRIGDRYYLCFQGVWFLSASPTGPWQAADKVPLEIYSIPESSSKYHVTYVQIYGSTPSTIVVGYTPGYYGAFVFGGVVVWGTGYYYPPYVAVGVSPVPVYWGAACYTYGASVWYNPATGVYARGAAAYGPYGGYGAAAAYNPRTGTYAQGAAVWGPNGGAAAGRTYNPTTGTYSAGYKAANPYGSWGEGVVGNGSQWAHGGYQSTSRGTIAAGETSQGGKGVAVDGANGKNGYLAKSGSGDVYAGANGNVYKRDNGQWYQNQEGSWNAINKGDLSAQQKQAAARDRGNWNSRISDRQSGAKASAGARSQGFEQRPKFQGRRRG